MLDGKASFVCCGCAKQFYHNNFVLTALKRVTVLHLPTAFNASCSKLRWLLPYYTADERRQLLDSCLNTRLLQSYQSSSLAGDAV
jgi:hypothetical protein